MGSYERSSRVAADLDSVWAFHSTIEGLVALTPDWMRLRVDSILGPDGDRLEAGDVLEVGTRLTLSVRPLGVGPRQSWRSVIRARERTDGAAYFRDEMVEGPFDRWVHTHSFFADGDETVLQDRVEYRLPLGGVGRAVEGLAGLGFGPMFRDRHRRTRSHLEG